MSRKWWVVYDNNKRADNRPGGALEGNTFDTWTESKFENLQEAIQYADNWLGHYGPARWEPKNEWTLRYEYQQNCVLEIRWEE